MSKNPNKSIIDEVKEEVKAKKKTEKSSKTPKRVSFELRTLIGWAGIIALIVGAYIAGVITTQQSEQDYRNAVNNEAVKLVDQLKSSK